MTRTLDDGNIDRIALRWDAHERGFYIDIIVSRDPRNHEIIAAHLLDQQDLRTQERVNARQASTLPKEKVKETLLNASTHKAVNGMVTNCANVCKACVSNASDPLNCRMELTGNNRKLTRDQAAKLFAHIGCSDPTCWVCRMVKGYKTIRNKNITRDENYNGYA